MYLTFFFFFFFFFFIFAAVLLLKNIRYNQQLKGLKSKLKQQNKKTEEQEKKISDLEKNIKTKLEKARNVHQRMLPDKLEEPEEFFISDYYQPAEYIGGDYYNFFKIDHGSMDPFFDQYLLYFFDVSGHGIDSTLLSIFVNDSIENYFKLRHSPGEMISTKELMNYIEDRYQKEGFPDDYLVCLFIAVLDQNQHTLNYSSGGFQYPVYKLNEKEEVEEINIGGLPISTALGSLKDLRQEKTIDFEKNSSLVLSTDGLLEQSNGSDIYFEQFEKLISKYKFLPAPFLKDIIRSDFYGFTGDNQGQDDITYLILERPEGEIFNYTLKAENKEEVKNELLEFLNQNQWSINQPLTLFKDIIFSVMTEKSGYLKIKGVNNQNLLMISFEAEDNDSNWDRLFNEYPELISIAEKDLSKNNSDEEELNLDSEELYYSHNNLNNRIYLLLLKNK